VINEKKKKVSLDMYVIKGFSRLKNTARMYLGTKIWNEKKKIMIIENNIT